MKCILVLLLYTLVHLQVCSQTYDDKYDLSFKKYNKCRWGWQVDEIATLISLDKDVSKKEKGHIKMSHRVAERINKTDTIMCFALSQCVPLPKYKKGETCTVSIYSKSWKMDNAFLVLTSFDEEENVFFNDSIKLDNTNWRDTSLTFQLLKEKVVRININYYGNDDPEQTIWLDKVSIKIENKDIAEYDACQLKEEIKADLCQSIDEKYIIPLSKNSDNSILPILLKVKDKKIIGLGECVHGSQPIKESIYQFIRVLVEKGSVRLLMVERPIDLLLKYDLFIQGYTPEEYITQIEEDLKCSFDDYKSFSELLIWLRKYNSFAKSKIHFVGVDLSPVPHIALYQYYMILLGEEASIPYLRLLKEKKYGELIDRTCGDISFLSKIDEMSFEFYIYFLKNCVFDNPILERGSIRDIKMAERVRKAVSIFCGEDEKAVLHMHSSHLSRVSSLVKYPFVQTVTGNLLNEWFGKMYFPISFQIGEGEYTEDECSVYGKTISAPLFRSMPQSFEGVALNTKFEYFFYPSSNLGHNIILANRIGRMSRYKEKEQFFSLRKHFDAYVFIRYSTHLNNVELYPSFYMSSYLNKMHREFEKIVEK